MLVPYDAAAKYTAKYPNAVVILMDEYQAILSHKVRNSVGYKHYHTSQEQGNNIAATLLELGYRVMVMNYKRGR